MLHPAVFQALHKEAGCFDIDLFATRVNHQALAFVSWRPEPGAVATDAFNVKWDFQLACLFPPFCMIERCLKKIQYDQSHCVLITPVLKSRPWYPVILSLLVGQPWLLPRRLDLLRLPGTSKTQKDTPPLSSNEFQAGCMAHFRETLTKKGFSQKSQISFSPLGERKLPVSMEVPGRHGIAGVLSGRLIRFQPL